MSLFYQSRARFSLKSQIAFLLDVSQRTVELEKQRIGKSFGITTAEVTIWAIENR
jgi:hypothetical protein